MQDERLRESTQFWLAAIQDQLQITVDWPIPGGKMQRFFRLFISAVEIEIRQSKGSNVFI